jgi:hypothetical protein
MTNQGVNFHLPPGGQISAAVDSGVVSDERDPSSPYGADRRQPRFYLP